MMRKKLLALLLAAACILSMAACGSDDKGDAQSVNNDLSVEQEEPDEDIPTAPAIDGAATDAGIDKPDEQPPEMEPSYNEPNKSAQSTGAGTEPSGTGASQSQPSSGGSTGGTGASSGSTDSESGSGTGRTATKSEAQGFIGQSASSMISSIGSPVSRSYSSSCMGDGEDGELVYDGFTVYTYRENGNESVVDVE